MASPKRNKYQAVPGINPAPLIGEKLGQIDYHFMKRKQQLSKDMPFLTYKELTATGQFKIQPFEDTIILGMITRGYPISVSELNNLLRRDSRKFEKRLGRNRKHLRDDESKLKCVAEALCDSEDFERVGEWRGVILTRLTLVNKLLKFKDECEWLAEKILRSCLKYEDNLSMERMSNMDLIGQVHLNIAYFLSKHKASHEETSELLLEALDHLGICTKLTEKIYQHINHEMHTVNGRLEVVNISLMQITVDRLIALHGWKVEPVELIKEAIKSTENPTFSNASVLWSQILTRIATHLAMEFHSCETATAHRSPSACDTSSQGTVESLYDKAVQLAIAGQNQTNILNILYRYGNFLMSKGLLDKADKVFKDLHYKSLLYKDSESLAISFNRMGHISYRTRELHEALRLFVNEWKISLETKRAVLTVDSLQEIGKILLEETNSREADLCYTVAFRQYIDFAVNNQVQFEQKHENEDEHASINITTKDDHYDKAWAMAGIATGHAVWGRLASTLRKNDYSSLNIALNWKTCRRPISVVHRPNYRPEVIVNLRKHRDVGLISKKYQLLDMMKDENKRVVQLTREEHVRDWFQHIEQEEMDFKHDIDARAAAYKENLITKSTSMAVSLDTVRYSARNSLKVDLDQQIKHNVRTRGDMKDLIHDTELEVESAAHANLSSTERIKEHRGLRHTNYVLYGI